MSELHELYEASEDSEQWTCGDCIETAADSALDSYVSELLIPWRGAITDWKPSKGMVIDIAAGNIDRLTWGEIAPDLQEQISERLYDEVGESHDFQLYPDNLQELFIGWLEKTIGKISCYSVVDICTVQVKFDGKTWNLLGSDQ